MSIKTYSNKDIMSPSFRRNRGGTMLELQDYGVISSTNTNETWPATARLIAQTTNVTAVLLKTLPSVAAFPVGIPLIYADFTGTVSVANTIVLLPAGSDTIDGGASLNLQQARCFAVLYGDGGTRWKLAASSVGVDILSLPAGTTPAGTDLVIGIQGGALVTFTKTQIMT